MTTRMWRLLQVVSLAVGLLSGALLYPATVDSSAGYHLFVTVLLAIGLYVSTHGIGLAEFRRQFRIVLLAVTLGVAAKIAVIFAVMYFVYRDPSDLVIAVAVAQIDPLAVAAVRAKSRMPEQTKVLLSAWASFDDPITALCTAYAIAVVLGGPGDGSGTYSFGRGLVAFLVNLLANILLVAVVYLMWRGLRTISRHQPHRGRLVLVAGRIVVALAVLVAVSAAVYFSLLLAIAVVGLFVRPRFGHALDRVARVASLLAVFAAGLVLVQGIDLGEGLVLGAAAYGAHIVVALALTTPKAWRRGRGRLALAQQNGMTAIILALLIEPVQPGAIATIGPAIIVVNVLHGVCNGLWDRLRPPEPMLATPQGRTVNRP
jgi:NhaP-type Na+/H+ or K+/H+ antiporter